MRRTSACRRSSAARRGSRGSGRHSGRTRCASLLAAITSLLLRSRQRRWSAQRDPILAWPEQHPNGGVVAALLGTRKQSLSPSTSNPGAGWRKHCDTWRSMHRRRRTPEAHRPWRERGATRATVAIRRRWAPRIGSPSKAQQQGQAPMFERPLSCIRERPFVDEPATTSRARTLESSGGTAPRALAGPPGLKPASTTMRPGPSGRRSMVASLEPIPSGSGASPSPRPGPGLLY